MQGCRGAGVQGCRAAGLQGRRAAGVHGCRGVQMRLNEPTSYVVRLQDDLRANSTNALARMPEINTTLGKKCDYLIIAF